MTSYYDHINIKNACIVAKVPNIFKIRDILITISYMENFRGKTLLINCSLVAVLRTGILQQEGDPTQVLNLNMERIIIILEALQVLFKL